LNFLVSLAALSTLVLVVAVLERMPWLRFRRLSVRRPYLGTDAAWFLLAATASAISVFVFRPQLSKLAIEPIGRWVGDLPVAAQLLLALILFDLVSFLVHVGFHRSETLWNFHKVHHSSLRLDGLATTRAHMFENVIRFVSPQAVLFLIGMQAEQVAPVVAIYAAFAVFNHSNFGIDFRWAEGLFVTPRMHRRHHIPSTSQANFGTIFSVWDRLFGSLVTRDTAPHERFGVPGEIDSFPQRLVPALRRPFLEIRRLREGALATRTR
jgi:sterol desaturase/sphingolipid hydroxylase (fatty acid hydroxylase superfamily)